MRLMLERSGPANEGRQNKLAASKQKKCDVSSLEKMLDDEARTKLRVEDYWEIIKNATNFELQDLVVASGWLDPEKSILAVVRQSSSLSLMGQLQAAEASLVALEAVERSIFSRRYIERYLPLRLVAKSKTEQSFGRLTAKINSIVERNIKEAPVLQTRLTTLQITDFDLPAEQVTFLHYVSKLRSWLALDYPAVSVNSIMESAWRHKFEGETQPIIAENCLKAMASLADQLEACDLVVAFN